MFGVVTCRREVHQDLVAPLNVDVLVELHVVLCHASHRHRRVETQELFDGNRQDFRLGSETFAVRWVGGEVPQRRPDRTPRGVDAGDDQQVGDADDDLRRDLRIGVIELHEQQLGQEIFPWILHPFGHLSPDEAEQLFASLQPQLRIVEPGAEHTVDPDHELVGHAGIDADHVSNHPRRDLLGVLLGTVATARFDELVDQRVGQFLGVTLVLKHRFRRERRQQHTTSPGMDRRIGRDRGGGDHLLVARHLCRTRRGRHHQHLP